jgi:hypothetical protein
MDVGQVLFVSTAKILGAKSLRAKSLGARGVFPLFFSCCFLLFFKH